MDEDKETYIQLTSWEELVAFIEKAQLAVFGKDWNPKPPRRKKKAPPAKGQGGLF